MKTKTSFSLYTIVCLVILGLVLIGSAIAMTFVGGYTSKNISIIIAAIAVSAITNNIHQFFIKQNKEDKDERNISIEYKSKAKAFDVMEIILCILIIIYVLQKANLLTIVLVGLAYLIIQGVYMAFLGKYHKEM